MARRLAVMAPEAREWLKREIAYIAERSPRAAEKVAANFREARTLLADYPGAARRGSIPGTFLLFVRPRYIFTLRRRDGKVEIVAIRSTSQSDALAPEELSESPNDPMIDESPAEDPFKTD